MSLLFDFCLHFMTRATEYTLTCNLGFPKTVHTNGIHPFRIFKAAQKLEPPYFFFFFFGGGRGGGGGLRGLTERAVTYQELVELIN